MIFLLEDHVGEPGIQISINYLYPRITYYQTTDYIFVCEVFEYDF